ncbi:MAG: TonB-dependent receptor [Burkholderiales bacterium]|nr:TonB-dependent receptor [Burkholderiales bacterium]
MKPFTGKYSLVAIAIAQLFPVVAFAQDASQAGEQIAAATGPVVEVAAATAGADGTAQTAADTIIVEAQRSTNAMARAAQKDAPNLVNLMTAEDIRKLPDVSVGESLRRIPGISLETDTGEGRYINIRGIDSDLNSTTFGGLRLPASNNASPQVGGRAVAMDAIPNGLVGAITVTKTNLPEQDAEAIGGTIEITPKTAPSNGRAFAEGHIGSGYEALRGTGITDLTVSAGGRFGGDGNDDGSSQAYRRRPFSIVATAAYYEDKRGIDDVEPAFIDAAPYAAPSQASVGWDQRWYQYHRQRHAYGLDLGYTPDANNSFYVRGFDVGYTETVHRQRLTVSPDGAPTMVGNSFVDTLALNGFDKTLRDEKEKIGNDVIVLGGKSKFGDDSVLDYRIGYTRGSYDKLYDYNSDFNYTPQNGNAAISYNFTGEGYTPLYTISNADYLNPANYSLVKLVNSTETIRDTETSGAANYKMPVRWLDGEQESFKLGISDRNRHRSLDNPQYSLPGSLLGLPLTSAISGSNISFYNGQYQNMPQINVGQLQAMYGGQMTSTPSNIKTAELSYARDKENVSAAYGQYQWERGDYQVITGIRVERTHGVYDGIAASTDGNGNNVFTPVEGNKTYTNWFPSLQGRYTIDQDTQVRAALSSTIARPGFPQVSPSLTVDTGADTVTSGNPQLKPITAHSFDLSLEHYMPNAGIASIGVFDKEISNYIVANQTSQVFPNSGIFAGLVGAAKVYTFSNAGSSYARGLELNYEQRFKHLPGIWGGLGAGVNYTYVSSRFEIRPGEYATLPSTSRNTGNVSLFYEREGVTLRLGGYYTSADLWAVGGSKQTDVWNDGRFTVDFGSSVAIDRNLSVYLNAKNVTNTPLKFYEGQVNRTIQREFYGPTYQAGLNFNY